MLLVDTNILVDVFEDDPDWVQWSVARLREQSSLRTLAINPVIYSELAFTFSTIEKLDAVIAGLRLVYKEFPRAALFLAGKAFAQYKRRGGVKTNVLSDFFIGAHAAILGCPLLTRDPARYRTYFPTVDLITPES